VETRDFRFPSEAAEALARVGRLLAETLDPLEVASRIADSVGRLLDPVAAAVYQLTADGDLRAMAVAGDVGVDAGALVFHRGTGLGAVAVEARATVATNDILTDPRVHLGETERARLEGGAYRAALAVPLIARGRVIGVLGLGLQDGRRLEESMRRVVEAFADQAALALDNARLHAETLIARRRLEVEHRAARVLADAHTVADAIPTLLGTLCESLGWHAGAFWLVDTGAGLLRPARVWTDGDAHAFETATRSMTLTAGEGLPGRVWAAGSPVWIPDVAADAGFIRRAGAAAADLHAALGFPVTVAGGVLGVVELFGPAVLEPDADMLRTLASVGGQIGQFMERKRAESALAESNRQFKSLFDSALEAVLIADDERRYVDANEAAADLFGVRREALIGLRIDDFAVAMDTGGVEGAWREFLDTGEQTGEITLVRPDGGLRIVEYSARAHFVPGRHLSILRDVTARRIAEREREIAQNRFAVLAELAQTLSQTLDRDVVGERVADMARTLLRAKASILYRLTDEGLVVAAVSGATGSGFVRGQVLPRDAGTAGVALRERRPVFTGDVLADDRAAMSPEREARPQRVGYRSVLAVPLALKGELVGAFTIDDEAGRVFSSDEIRVAQAFADHAAIALENARIFALETARRAQMESLAEIERDLTAELDPERLLGLIIGHLGRFFRGGAGLYLMSEDGVLVRRAWAGEPAGPERLELGRGLVGRAAERREGMVLNDYEASDEGLEALRSVKVRHGMAQPLIVHGRLLGTIGVGRMGRDAARFTAEEHALLGRLATQAAIAIDNARLYAEAARGQREAEVVADVARAVNEALDINAILPLVGDAARALTGADTASIALRELGREALVFRYHSGQRSRRHDEIMLPVTSGLTARVLSTGRALRTDDVRSDPEAAREARWLLDIEGVVSLLVAPIAFGGRVEGLVFVANRRAVPFTRQDESIVQRLADQGATALRNVRLLAAEQAARSAAEAANRMKDDFLATVSHELRTPLTAMLGWVWWLRRGAAEESMRDRALETVERNARAQAQLVEDLLDVSRIVTGKLRLEVRMSDLRAVIEAAADSVRTAADAKGIALETRLPAAPVAVTVDPDRLLQVVWNLLSNAIKFTPEGGRVQVELQQDRAEVRVVVRDTGAGISPAFLPYVFDRFRQAEASSTRAYGGLGLGLAIVRHLVELHGGVVRAESDGEGRGTTFTVTLPVRAERRLTAEDAVAHLQAARGPSVRTRALEGLHVLVVEDAEDTRELLATILTQHGATVDAVESVAAAREALARRVPGVLVSDIGMRGEDGYTLIRELRRRPDATRAVPAVAVTAYAGIDDRRRALREGFDAHVAKPVEPDQLVALIADLAASSGGRKETA
jgi:PAS domain S-box-containing protein